MVNEPPSADRRNGAVYQVGKLLGKGGFAICYDGKLAETGKRYALKIVKSQMPMKMQQKVGGIHGPMHGFWSIRDFADIVTTASSKPSCKYIPR